MSWDDDNNLLRPFNTREGTATGHANERTMLGIVGGPNTIRTQLRDNPDGSQTRLKTRGGFAEFVTTDPKKIDGPTKSGPFLYYKLGSDVHPFGWGKKDDGHMSGRWQWPAHPVSYSEVTSTTDSLVPKAFKSADGPGTLTWEDTRAVQQTKAVLSWSPAFGNGRSAPTAYMAGNLNSVWPSSPKHLYTFDGDSESDEPGRSLPGQKMPGGAGGHLRFIQVPTETVLYEDGKDTGVYGYILAACIVIGQDERWRTIEFIPRQTLTDDLVLRTKAYRKDGTFAGSATVTMNLPGFSKLTEIIQPPRFNSSGTQAAGIVRYAKTGDQGGGVAVIVIDWASAQANVGVVKADSFDTVEYSAHSDQWSSYFWPDAGFDFSGERQVSVPISVDYTGDAMQLLWTKYRRVYEEHRIASAAGTSNDLSESLSITHTSSSTSTMELWLNDSVIKTVTSSWHGDLSVSATLTRVITDPERPWLLRNSSVTSAGTWTKTYSPFGSFITDVMADLRRGVIAYCVETDEGYSDTASESLSRTFTPGYPDTVMRNATRETPALTKTAVIEVMAGGVTQVATVSGSVAEEVSFQSSASTPRIVAFGADNKIFFASLDAEAYNRANQNTSGWEVSGYALNSAAVESLSMAVDKSGSTVFISGLLCNGLAKAFTPFAKIIRAGGVSSMPVSTVTSDEGQPGYIWVTEPIFLDHEVTP